MGGVGAAMEKESCSICESRRSILRYFLTMVFPGYQSQYSV